jgi:peptidoglycan DL-endopeptidase LytE
MMKRRIFLWMGLSVLFLSTCLCTEGFSKERYQVKQGSTLFTIAKKYGVSVADLKKANNLRGNALKPGQILTIPDRKEATAARAEMKVKPVAKGKTAPASKTSFYVVKKGDSIYSIAKKTGLSVAEIKQINHLRSNALKPGRKLALARHGVGRDDTQDAVVSRKKTSAFDLDDDDLEDDSVAVEDDPKDIEKERGASSSLLGTWNNPEEPRLLVRVVKGFLGTPYRMGGSTVRGIDCSGFVAKIYEFFDVSLPRTAREQARVGKVVSKDELVEGDLVFFNTRRAFGHVGIYIGNNEFIHASSGRSSKAVRIDNLDKPYYHKRFIKAVRLKGIDDKSAVLKSEDGKV